MRLNMHRSDSPRDRVASATDTLADAGDALASSKDELVKEFRNLLKDGEALLRSSSNLSGDALTEARNRFRDQLANARTQLSAATRIAAEKSRQAASVTDDYVHANPWPAIGVAAGVGFAIGALLLSRL